MYYHYDDRDATPAQRKTLLDLGIAIPHPLSMRDADYLIKKNQAKWSNLPPTERQRHFLVYRGRWRVGMTRGEASELIARIKDGRDALENSLPLGFRDGWLKPGPLPDPTGPGET
jgi:hypothetical protein